MTLKSTSRNLLFIGAAGLALAGCETINETVGNNYAANLSGAEEVPPADPDGSGSARISTNDVTNQICVDLEVRNLDAVTAAHIHRGAKGVNGPPVVNLDPPDDDDSDDCDTIADSLLDEIRNNPAGFYVNVHTAAHPDGAIRGQIFNVPG